MQRNVQESKQNAKKENRMYIQEVIRETTLGSAEEKSEHIS